jgi:ribonuclease HI
VQVVVHVDGGARGNPGPAAAAAVVSAPDGRVLDEAAVTLGRATNNVAEYRGLLLGLERAAALGATEVDVVNDSELIARQVEGAYKVKSAELKPLHAAALEALARFERWSIRSVPRAQNAAADALVNRALDGEAAPLPAAAEGDELVRAARRAGELWAQRMREELASARRGSTDAAARAAAIERLLRDQAELLMALGVEDPPEPPEDLSRALRELRPAG